MESSGSGTSKKLRPKDEFTDILFSWSLGDIFDENLYNDKIGKIPESFGSVDHYLDSYLYPLLEEARAELAFAEVKHIQESEHEKLLYSIKVDYWRNRRSDGDRTLPGDFVLLSDSKPERLSDAHTFAAVINISGDDCDDSSTFSGSEFKLKTAGGIKVDDKQSKPLYVVYLMNMSTNRRIWRVLQMRRNLKIIEKVLTKNDSAEGNCESCPLNVNDEMEEKFGATLFSKLNESQLESILACTSKIRCSHRSSVELVWGPPGTGKTRMLSGLLYILLRMNVRTLVCAPTNIAIKELASRVTALMRNSVEIESETSLSCPLGDMLIFGNKDRLDVGSDIEEVFLDYRAERLLDCLSPQTGWRQCVASMLDFLEYCVAQHRFSEEPNSFLEFVRDRFRHMASALRSCILTLYAHLPRSCINELDYQNILELISILDSMEMLLFEDSMTSERLEAIFLETSC